MTPSEPSGVTTFSLFPYHSLMNTSPAASTMRPSGAWSNALEAGWRAPATGNGSGGGSAGVCSAPRENERRPAQPITITMSTTSAAPATVPNSRRCTRRSRSAGARGGGISVARSWSRSRRSSVIADLSDQGAEAGETSRGEGLHGPLAAPHGGCRLRDIEILVVAQDDRRPLSQRKGHQRALQDVA